MTATAGASCCVPRRGRNYCWTWRKRFGCVTATGSRWTSGGVVQVCARPEKLLEIHAHDEGELVRIAWHLGNRHLPVQLLGDRIRIRADHVIREMVEGLGGHVDEIEAPFDPEAGAYAGGHNHHHHHDDD